MKFKIYEFLTDILAALLLYWGIFNIYVQENIVVLCWGIWFISISIFMFIIKNLDFINKSKVEKAEEKAIKHKKKLENKDLKQRNKAYKLLKKEIFKRIAKGYSTIVLSTFIEPGLVILDRLNHDEDFKELHFTLSAARIYWERKNDGK